MDVAGADRKPAQVRVPAALLVVGVVVAIGALVYLTGSFPSTMHPNASSTAARTTHSATGRAKPDHGAGASGTAPVSATGFFLKSATPDAGDENVPSNITISLTFSEKITLKKVTPVLTPAIPGQWVQTAPSTLAYRLQSPFVPGTQESLTLPSGASGLRAASGAELSNPPKITFDIAAGDLLRVQQLLAQLDYLPLSFTQTGPATPVGNLAMDQPGSFAWRWSDQPSQLTSLWTQGTTNEITKAAVEAFENANNIGVDGEVGPAVWTALLKDTINHAVSANPYVYVLVNKVVPQNLTLYEDGVAKYVGIPVNSGAPGADTTDGNYAVFEHVRFSDMKGTNVDGSTYNDPNVPYASYFNGGDALHGFVRASYGTPQSNGCIEMSYADAALVWALTPIGTLVTIEGPNFGTAPPPTTTTTTAAAPTTTTTVAPPPAATATTVAPPASPTTAASAAPPAEGTP